MVDLFIYYKVPGEHAAALWPRVHAMQAQLADRYGVDGRLRRRPHDQDGLQTWMEIYPAADAAFETALADAVRDAGIAALIDGPRHIEVFTDSSPCA